MKIRKILAVTAIGLLIAGCKIKMTVPEGGDVVDSNDEIVCAAGDTCSVFVNDIFFDETYTAVPHEGMAFTGWEKRNRGFCGGQMAPCHLFTSGFEGSDTLMPFLEDDTQTFHLNPTFAADDGSGGGATACEFIQDSPGGEFEVCAAAENIDESSCVSLAGAFFGGNSSVTDRDCTAGQPVGYCETDDADFYYYDHGASLSGLETGCGFAGGTWHTL